METLIGFMMMYIWAHGIVIVASKTKDTTTYEKTLLVAGVALFVLYLIGTAA